MGHPPRRKKKTRPWTGGWRAAAVATVFAFALSGCGSDGPTEPKQTTLSDLFGTQLFRADGSSVGLSGMDGTSLIGIYFASTGCPACGAFNPTLVEAYNQWSSEGKSFEVVLVTSGVGLTELLDYMVEYSMPWRAISPQSSKANSLIQRYNIRWVPTLVVIDAATNTVTMTGREELAQTGAAIYDVWAAASG